MKKTLKQLIEDSRKHYESIGRVWCPVLNSHVYFTSEGFNHLIYKPNRKKRLIQEQEYKLNLLPLVIPVLKHSKQLSTWRFVGDTQSGHDMQEYSLVHTVGKQKIETRVIVRRAGDGQFNFCSVMPHGNKKSRRK